MRIHILSDLHLEFAPFQPSKVDADVIVLAGDIHTGKNLVHEFYGQKIPKLITEIKEVAQDTNVHVLENDSVELGDVAFLGAKLWTDFRLNGDPVLAEVAAQTGMTDFRRIRVTPSYRRFRPRDARRIHAQSLEWLAQQASNARGRKIIVVTHHAPSPQSVPAGFQKDQLNPAYASNLEPFIAECGAALWIHGHIHHRADFNVGMDANRVTPYFLGSIVVIKQENQPEAQVFLQATHF